MRMNKMLWMLMPLFLIVTACSKVPAGYVGIKVYLLGNAKGVDHEEVPVGWIWIGIHKELFLFPIFEQNYVWTADVKEGSPNDESFTFQTSEGLGIGADIGISYNIDPAKVSTVFEKYRRGIDEITDTFLRNHVRDALNTAASDMTAQDIYGPKKTVFMDTVQAQVQREVDEIGIRISRIYLIGTFRLPPNVVAALNSKIEATQRAQQRENEIREAQAVAKKLIATAEGEAKSILVKAEAQAKANKALSASLSPNLIQYEKIQKWDGKLPQVAGHANPFISIGK